MHPAAGVRAGAAQIEPANRGLRPAEAGQRPEDQLLVELGGAAVDRPTDKVAIGGHEVAGRLHHPVQHPVPEAGGVPLQQVLHRLDLPPHHLGVARDAARQVRVRPHHLGACRGPGGIGGGHLAEQQERPAGPATVGQVRRVVGQPVEVAAEVHGAGTGDLGRRPGDRAGQRPVQLQGGRVPGEAPQVGADPIGQPVRAHQIQVEGGHIDVGDHRPSGQHPARAGLHAPGPATHHDDLLDPYPAAQLAAGRPQTLDQRLDELPRATPRDREAEPLTHHGHQPAEQAAPRLIRRYVRVQRGAGEEQPGPIAPELLRPEPPYRQRGEAGGADSLRRAHPGQQASARAYGWERAEQRVEHVVGVPVPALDERLPGSAVARRETFHRARRLGQVAGEHHRPVVGEQVRQRRGGVAPAQAVLLQPQRAQDGRRRAERIERAEQVGGEARPQHLRRPDRASGRVVGLQHEDVPAGVGQQVGGDQTVMPRPDDNRVVPVVAHRACACWSRMLPCLPGAAAPKRVSRRPSRQRSPVDSSSASSEFRQRWGALAWPPASGPSPFRCSGTGSSSHGGPPGRETPEIGLAPVVIVALCRPGWLGAARTPGPAAAPIILGAMHVAVAIVLLPPTTCTATHPVLATARDSD
ncbi:hypothetical protein B0E53_02540 [Micromonospora sp. MH33]|nr:hypothetical protein B0E53_02540 [Micromonospora sp. MH33]